MRETFDLLFGDGLDRATGIMAVKRSSMQDVRNALLREGKARARAGLEATALAVDEFGAELDHVCGIFPVRSEGSGIVVAYSEADRRVHVNRVGGDGSGVEWLGVWFTNPAGSGVPRVLAAEVQERLYLAHDEPRVLRRAVTRIYDPKGVAVLGPLEVDLDNDATAEGVRFRGVERHGAYLFGWGYGTGALPSRPETVRDSLPGQPSSFPRNNYGRFGAYGDPVVRCMSHPAGLLVFKGTETHVLRGANVKSWTQDVVDTRFGLAAARLAVRWGNRIPFWSLEGPRMTEGGESQDLELPLDLGGPAPEDLVAEGALEDGFADVDPGEDRVLFVFGRRVYTLHLRDPDRPRWSYDELGREPGCAGLLYGGASDPPPTGHPEAAATSDLADSSVTGNWSNHDQDGDESVQIWLKPGTGAWFLKLSVAVSAGSPQAAALAGLSSGTDYGVAYRYRRGADYTALYESADPDDWPASARGTFSTTITAPRIDTLTWSRPAAPTSRVALVAVLSDPTLRLEVLRADGEGADFADAASLTVLAPAASTYDDDTADVGAFSTWFVRHLAADDTPGAESVGVSIFAGPAAPTITGSWSGSSSEGWFSYDPGAGPLDATELETDVVAAGVWQPAGDLSGSPVSVAAPVPPPPRDSVGVRIRNRLTSFAVDDFSDWYNGDVPICTGCPA